MRAISWVRAAKKDFLGFPPPVRDQGLDALTLASLGETPGIAKPLKGFGAGVFELRISHRRVAFRVVYAVKLGPDLWVLHAFRKKSKTGIKTPRAELDLIRERLKLLKDPS